MAQFHVSKDPSNPSPIPFAYDPLYVKPRSGYSNCNTGMILPFLYNLKNDMIYRRIE